MKGILERLRSLGDKPPPGVMEIPWNTPNGKRGTMQVTFAAPKDMQMFLNIIELGNSDSALREAAEKKLKEAEAEKAKALENVNAARRDLQLVQQKLAEVEARAGSLSNRIREPNGEMREIVAKKFALVPSARVADAERKQADAELERADALTEALLYHGMIDDVRPAVQWLVKLLDGVHRRDGRCPFCKSRGQCVADCGYTLVLHRMPQEFTTEPDGPLVKEADANEQTLPQHRGSGDVPKHDNGSTLESDPAPPSPAQQTGPVTGV